MSPEAIWLSGFVQGLMAGVPLALLLFIATRPVVDAVLALAHRGPRR